MEVCIRHAPQYSLASPYDSRMSTLKHLPPPPLQSPWLQLQLSDNDLTGTMPSNSFPASLQILNLANNDLSGSVPQVRGGTPLALK